MLSTINLRKLAAIDIALLGYKLIFAEYAAGVLLSAGLGLFVVFRSHTFWQVVLGVYLICLGIDYVPMLAYTISMGSRERARAEIADELTDRRGATSKYRRVSLLLLVPLLAPLLALRRVQPASHDGAQSPE
jgi:hypothetical protein